MAALKSLFFLNCITTGSIYPVFAFAHLSTAANISTESAIIRSDNDGPHPTLPQLSTNLVKERVQSGRVYVHDDFLTESQLNLLQRDMQRLDEENKFIVNGLSDVRKGLKGESVSKSVTNEANQGFDVKYDRSVCPIPWWMDSLRLIDTVQTSESECFNDEVNKKEAILHSIQVKLQMLRKDLAEILERPTMMNSNLGHECYYSKSNPGSSLARHMDERHEEFKGPRGWLLPSRRSLSWLIYMSEADGIDNGEQKDQLNRKDNRDWDALENGGMLRTFPQNNTAHCGTHNGNLQIGWLLANENKDSDNDDPTRTLITHPVFLDCWHEFQNPYNGELEHQNILYIVHKPSNSNISDSNTNQIEHITVPWMSDAIGGNMMTFLQQRALLESDPRHSEERLFIKQNDASQFRLLEDRESWEKGLKPDGAMIEDILPKRGRLVVFDSVALPHEVTPVIKGFRSALAGWFHEETQALGG